MTIERSTGTPIPGTMLSAGGGYSGVTAELDAVVSQAAEQLAQAYGMDVEIRFNSDRESGGAWLKDAAGRHSWVGICAQLVTARARARWERSAVENETMAETGICTWGGPARPSQRAGAREEAKYWRGLLADCPEGQLTVCAHIDRVACLLEWQNDLQALPGWNDMGGRPDLAYHHGPADDVAAALARVTEFAPLSRVRELEAIATGTVS
jgi:hypothetical protein